MAAQLIVPGVALAAAALNALLSGRVQRHEDLARQAGEEFRSAHDQYLAEQDKLEHGLSDLSLIRRLTIRRIFPRISQTCAKVRPQELDLPADRVPELWCDVEASKSVLTGLVVGISEIKIPDYDGSLLQTAAATRNLHHGMAQLGPSFGGNLATVTGGIQAILITGDTLFRWYKIKKSAERTNKIRETILDLAVATPRVRAVRERVEIVARVTRALAAEVFRSSFFATEIVAACGETRLSRDTCAALSQRDRDQLNLFFVSAQALWEILDAPIINSDGSAAATPLPGTERQT